MARDLDAEYTAIPEAVAEHLGIERAVPTLGDLERVALNELAFRVLQEKERDNPDIWWPPNV